MSIKGNGYALGLTNGTNTGPMTGTAANGLYTKTDTLPSSVGTSISSISNWGAKTVGVIQDASKSGLTGSVTIPALAVGITNSLTLVSKKLGNLYIKY